MKRFTIKIARTIGFFVSNNSLDTEALSVVPSVRGTAEVQIKEEFDDQVTPSYGWIPSERSLETAEHLEKLGLRRVDW